MFLPTNKQIYAYDLIRRYHYQKCGCEYEPIQFSKEAYHNFIKEHEEEYEEAKRWTCYKPIIKKTNNGRFDFYGEKYDFYGGEHLYY